jgi:branched-chain amino acid transport system substrate-binding protein
MIPPMLDYFWRMGVRKIGVIYLSDPSGETPANEVLKPLWTKRGGTIVDMEPHQPGMTDFSAYLSRIKAGNPDAVCVLSTGEDLGYIVKGAREIGLTCPMSVSEWNNDFQAIAGKNSENVYTCIEFFDRTSSDPLTKTFVKHFEEKWKEQSEFFSANYFDAVYNIIPELIRRVVKNGGNPLRGEELEKAIWIDPSFKTVYGGELRIQKDGSVEKPMVIFKIMDGKMTVVEKIVGQK